MISIKINVMIEYVVGKKLMPDCQEYKVNIFYFSENHHPENNED